MSRSYKLPYVKDGYKTKRKRIAKQSANKSVRQTKHAVSNGNAYKKIYNSWDICDYIFYIPVAKYRRK